MAKLDADIAATKAEIVKQDALAFETRDKTLARDVSGKEEFVERFTKELPARGEGGLLDKAERARQELIGGRIFEKLTGQAKAGETVTSGPPLP